MNGWDFQVRVEVEIADVPEGFYNEAKKIYFIVFLLLIISRKS